MASFSRPVYCAGLLFVLPLTLIPLTWNRCHRYYGDAAAEIEMAIDRGDPKCPFLIQRDGETVFDWEESTLFHDLRRTALTNMIEAGFSAKEAMEISGHKTRNVFDRYHIVSSKRQKQLVEHLEVTCRQRMPSLASGAERTARVSIDSDDRPSGVGTGEDKTCW